MARLKPPPRYLVLRSVLCSALPQAHPPTCRLAGIFLLPLVAVVAACGAGESRSLAMEITEARWRDDTVVVSGIWMKGLSTPPACKLLKGRDGEIIGRFSLEGAAFDADAFSQEFVPDGGQAGEKGAGPENSYHVQCSVTLDSAKTATDTAPVTASG